ncbi:MAG: penicillin-binding protein 2 [Myxococcaceae bacterium]|nr:penicillin-binding protein 2 [Myxococcaceae bacterium]MCI0672532.1 penicillin-binding protein 2 [Myxococcaceae bacterium]
MSPVLGHNSPGRDLKVRYLWLGLAMLAGILALAVQLYRLQVIRHDEYTAKSVSNFVKETRILADRGMIKDAHGQILVQNRPSFDVFVTPAFCERCDTEVLPRVGQLLGWDAATLTKAVDDVKAARRKAPFRPVAVRIDLRRDELDILSAHLRGLSGVDVVAVPHRAYRTSTVLAHVLGYMNEISERELERPPPDGRPYQPADYVGRAGLERSFEATLRGEDGVTRAVVDARGQSIAGLQWLIDEHEVLPKPGNNLVLSIDMRLQEVAEQAFPGTAGAVVAVDVKTGFILAMVSRPGFDPNVLTGRVTAAQMAALAKDPLQPMIFRPTAQHYSPGSTFKVLTSIAAFRSGQFSPQSTATCHGGYRLGRRTWRCHLDRGHGVVDARTALQKSCDVWYYKVGDTLGLDPIAKVGEEFGLGQPTGIGVVGEVPGIMPTEAYHDRVHKRYGGYMKGFALNSSTGQGDVNVTPLQLALMYAAIANGGKVWVPQLVRSIEDAEGKAIRSFEPKLARQVELKPEHRKVLVDALVSVVNEPGGTAYRARLEDVTVAGKTGTAQVARLGAVRLKTHQMDYWLRDHAWFAAFAPAEDPEIAIVVLNEHGGHGGADAAPTAQAVFRKYFDLKREDSARAAGQLPVAAAPTGGVPVGAQSFAPPSHILSGQPAPVRAPRASPQLVTSGMTLPAAVLVPAHGGTTVPASAPVETAARVPVRAPKVAVLPPASAAPTTQDPQPVVPGAGSGEQPEGPTAREATQDSPVRPRDVSAPETPEETEPTLALPEEGQ